MRLLRFNNAGQLSLTEDLHGDGIPEYAILSHTWGPDEEEVTFEDMINGTGNNKAGYKKISSCGAQARRDGLQHFWVDTCCIDKRSSAELSESINSMYRWYKQAKICYAYIQDWPSELFWYDLSSIIPVDDSTYEMRMREEPHSIESVFNKPSSEGPHGSMHGRERYKGEEDLPRQSFKSSVIAQVGSAGSRGVLCRWFTRGWTLQELIAPKKMQFFDGDWGSRGMRSDPLVLDNLVRITGITPSVLSNSSEDSLRNVCFGQRMSWAAYRITSRVEDIAYSLLGIFQITMPLLYGEGTKAFSRLQEEILKSSTDLSLLAWSQDFEVPSDYRGLFSRHPREFRHLRQCRSDQSQFSLRDEIVMTNKGVRIETSLFYQTADDGKNVGLPVLSLGCCDEDNYLQGILLKNIKGTFVRSQSRSLVRIDDRLRRVKEQTICVVRDFDEFSVSKYELDVAHGAKVELLSPEPYMLELFEAWPQGYYDHDRNVFLIRDSIGFIGYLQGSIKLSMPASPKYDKTVIGQFMMVIVKDDDSQISVELFNKSQADELKDHINEIIGIDSRTAPKMLAQKLAHLWQNSTHVVMKDRANKSRVRVTANTYEREEASISGEAKSLTGVDITVDYFRG